MSPDLSGYWLLFGFGALFAGIFFWAYAVDKKTAALLTAIALRRGWRFHSQSDTLPSCLGRDIELFKRGRSSRVRFYLEFTSGEFQVEVFNFLYTTGRGESKDTTAQTVVAIIHSKKLLSKFSLVPENVFYKIANVFGYRDINFDHDREFSKKFRLNGDDEAQIRKLFNSELINALKTRGDISIQGAGNTLILFTVGKVVPPEQLEAAIEDLIALSQLFFR